MQNIEGNRGIKAPLRKRENKKNWEQGNTSIISVTRETGTPPPWERLKISCNEFAELVKNKIFLNHLLCI